MNKGDFLLEKVSNMSKWIDSHLDLGLADRAGELKPLQATVLAASVGGKVELAAKRDWDALIEVIADNAPVLLEATLMVRGRPEMHDKFWRYIDLFVDITQQ